jgi:hypothetical protein
MIELVYETHSLTTDNEHDIATGCSPVNCQPTEGGRRSASDSGVPT